MHREDQDEGGERDFVAVVFVAMASEDDEKNVEKSETDESDVDGLVLAELGIGKHIRPVDGHGQRQEATSERRQMSGEALGAIVVGQPTHLHRNAEMGERDDRDD